MKLPEQRGSRAHALCLLCMSIRWSQSVLHTGTSFTSNTTPCRARLNQPFDHVAQTSKRERQHGLEPIYSSHQIQIQAALYEVGSSRCHSATLTERTKCGDRRCVEGSLTRQVKLFALFSAPACSTACSTARPKLGFDSQRFLAPSPWTEKVWGPKEAVFSGLKGC
jgi:hypothetical protein